MIKKTYTNYTTFCKESQPLIRHCWTYDIYKKKLSKTSYKEKFVNFLTKDGKKLKAYNIFNRTGLLLRKKLLQTDKTIVTFKTSLLLKNNKEVFQKLRTLFFKKIKIFKKKKNSIIQSKKEKINKDLLYPYALLGTLNEKLVIKDKVITKKIDQNLNKTSSTKTIVSFEKKPKILKRKKKIFRIEKKTISSFNQLVAEAINNVKPNLEVRKVRIGRTTYLVPAIIPKKRQQTLAIKWILESARSRKQGKQSFFEKGMGSTKYISFVENLANELLEAFLKQGQARQKRDNLHKLVESNRAYTRYRWW